VALTSTIVKTSSVAATAPSAARSVIFVAIFFYIRF
jgi:hypothetical protein